MQNFGLSMLWFWICYTVVTCVGILHTIFNIYVLKMKPMEENGMGEGYEKTKPWHPLYNIILFSIFGWLYIKQQNDTLFNNFFDKWFISEARKNEQAINKDNNNEEDIKL